MALAIVSLMPACVPLPAGSQGVVVRRTSHANGRPFEVRRFRNGHEEGLQQAWTEDGTLYINYEMRNGRRYGYLNARPCAPVAETR